MTGVWTLLLSCSTECPEGSTMQADGLCHLDDFDDGTDDETAETGGPDETDETVPASVAILGGGTHSLDALVVTELAGPDDHLTTPRDLEFNPEAPDQLWIVDWPDDEVVILFGTGTSEQQAVSYSGDNADHWLAKPSAIAFGDPGYVATSHEDLGDGGGNPSFAMGPTLWPSSVDDFDGGQPSHLDMVHDSPLSQGIAWDRDNIYWVHDGYNRSITRYDFAEPHEPGGTWHDDAILYRYVQGEVGYVEGVPSHLAFDQDTNLLYLADTEFGRVTVLDTLTGEDGGCIPQSDGGTVAGGGGAPPPHDDGSMDKHYVNNADYQVLAEGDPLVAPSGIEIHDGLVFVTDNTTSKILAYATDGTLVDWLQTDVPEGGLMGITFDAEGQLYLVDAVGGRVLRLSVAE